jgi:hypothetical protein
MGVEPAASCVTGVQNQCLRVTSVRRLEHLYGRRCNSASSGRKCVRNHKIETDFSVCKVPVKCPEYTFLAVLTWKKES